MRHDQHFVEELTERAGVETVGVMMPTALIAPNPDQPRIVMGDLSELVLSIEEKGILEPILVRALAEDEAAPRNIEYLIISGERRYQAAKQVGLDELPVIVMEVDPTEALEIALVENLQRKDLTAFEEADGYRALGEVHGYTHAEVAKSVGKSRVSVTESLGLLKLGGAVRSAAEALGIESKSILLEVAKLGSDPKEQIALLERVADEGLTRRDLRNGGSASTSRAPSKKAGTPEKPVFTFKDPDKSFSVSVRFRKDTVDRGDLISALERIIQELRAEEA